MAKNSTNQKIIVGLDIGTTKIATVIGYRTEDGLINVIGHGISKSTGVEFGQIRNVIKTTNGIVASCKDAMERANYQIGEVYVGIAGHHIKTSTYNHHLFRHGLDYPISQEEIDKLRDEVFNVTVSADEEIVDVIPQRYLVDKDHETTDPVGEMGKEIIGTYQVITGKKEEVNKVRYCCNDSEVTLKDIILEPIASSLACLSEEDMDRGVALVDIGGGTSDLIIYIDGHPVYTKVIALGGNVITKDIATVCNITEDLAEQLKLKHGTCIVDQSNANNMITIPRQYQEPIQINENYLAQIINSRVQDEILGYINKELEESGYKKRLASGAGLVLTGGGAKLKHIKELSAFVTGLPTRIGLPDHGFVHNMATEVKQPNLSTALGLLKYGIGCEEDDTPYQPDSEPGPRKKDTPKDKTRFWGKFSNVGSWVKDIIDNIS